MYSNTLILPTLGAVLAGLIASTAAADCYQCGESSCGTGTVFGSRTDLYAARQDYCGNNLWENTQCYTWVSGSTIMYIGLNNPGANDQQTCWDAFEDIINQCMPGCGEGYYNYNNGQYYLQACGSYSGDCF